MSSSYYPKVTLATSVTVGTIILFSLAIIDKYGNGSTVSYSYTVTAISQAFGAGTLAVVGDSNGDGKLSPGETGYLEVSITNTGAATALGVTGTLTTSASGVTITSGVGLNFSDISGGVSSGDTTCGVTSSSGYGLCGMSSSYYPKVTLATTVAKGTVISFSLAITDKYGNKFTVAFSASVY